jgi:hypothetical protein
VAGTPGTLPTNWTGSSTADGVTREIVGIGTENGISYIDIRFSGTPTAGTNSTISFDAANQIAASSGQTWTESVYLKLQAGSFSGTSTAVSLLGTNGSSGTEAFNTSLITSTPSNLAAARLSVTATFAVIGTTHAQPRVRIGYTVGTAFDITLRIGLPQLELGAFATSVIPTTTIALTRNADVATMTGTNFSSWYNAVEGTLFANFVPSIATSCAVLGIDSGVSTSQDSILVQVLSGSTLTGRVRYPGTTDAAALALGSLTANSQTKITFSYKTNDFAGTLNAAAVVTDTSGSVVPSPIRLFVGSNSFANTVNGTISRIAYYPTRLPNTTLQALTA